MFLRSPRPRYPRSGVTLVEMLVTVALLVLMMTVIVQIFQAATGSVTAAKTYQELDNSLRQLDSTLRTDLANVTARFTPPLDPKDNLGYFEYGENSFADLQGEDADDYIRFTTKAPEGQLFFGRFYPPPATNNLMSALSATQLSTYRASMPITIQSQYAEVIYFLRNGNLYRRVLLVAPELQSEVNQLSFETSQLAANANVLQQVYGNLQAGVFLGGTTNALSLSWQGLNDLSAHPKPTGPTSLNTIILNSLSDLTNRENRFGYSRFANDFLTYSNTNNVVTFTAGADGTPDDANQDTVPDYYPTLYPHVFNSAVGLIFEDPNYIFGATPHANTTTTDQMAFPYTFPAAFAYSRGDSTSPTYGLIHSPDPSLNTSTLAGLQALNHSPLDIGDSLPFPGLPSTWWGFPTWRETLGPNWNDPYTPLQINSSAQPACLSPSSLTTSGPSISDALPPMTTNLVPVSTSSGSALTTIPFRLIPQIDADAYDTTQSTFIGGSSYLTSSSTGSLANPSLWKTSWEDDLIATGVRSFDVKAYDNSYPGYVDLGWGDDVRLSYPISSQTAVPFNPTGTNTVPIPFPWPPSGPVWGMTNGVTTPLWDTYNQTFAHEGRMPPLVADLRMDSQTPIYAGAYRNIGDSQQGLNRLRRVFDTWSTDYSRAPATGVCSSASSVTVGAYTITPGQPMGPPFTPPIYPSYPAPYPAALRGIQIQIRMVDPKNERLKVLTIRQDFSDKL